MFTTLPLRQRSAHPISFEHLESRINLSGDCLFEVDTQDDVARAAQAINCFALDLYEHFQNEQGNLFLSPLSIATALAMTYAGAAGDTAAEMEEVLHLGTEPGIHASIGALLSSLDEQVGVAGGFELEVANAIWPHANLSVRDDFLGTIETDYGGKAESLDYADSEQARDIINSWVEEKTRGRVKDLIEQLSPATAMVLTNSIYLKALWVSPFVPGMDWTDPRFYRDDGEIVEAPMMYTQAFVHRTELDGFQVMEMPFQGGGTSMVFVLPQERNGPNEVTPELLVGIDDWLESRSGFDHIEVTLPKFEITVAANLQQLLAEMGMPRAFGPAADFSAMTDSPLWIDQVRHKAFLEVTEQGIEAGAATAVGMAMCFAAGTPVLTPDGEKPIEQLKAGDYVLSRDEHNVEGEIQQKLVERTFRGQSELINLHVGGQIIRVTKEHRFFVKGRGWMPAGEMRAGDLLATDLCSWREIDQISATGEVEPICNLRVADHHTYFVGSQSWGFAVWTHNLYGDGFYADHPFHFLIRDNATSTLLFMGRINDPTQSENSLTPTVERIAGDSNGDGRFNSADLVFVFQAGKYEDGIAGNADFAEGDWNGDGDFDSSDLVMAFQSGLYEHQPPAVRSSIFDDGLGGIADQEGPEPMSPELLDAFFALEDTLKKRSAFVA